MLRPLGFALAALLALALAGCMSDEERFDWHLERAEEFVKSGELENAALELQSALALEPDNAEASFRLGSLAFTQGRFEEATYYFRAAYRADRDHTPAALSFAGVMRGQNPELALKILDRVIEREPDNPKAYIERAELRVAHGDSGLALADARTAERLAPELPEVHWELARVHELMIRERRLTRQEPEDALFASALAGYDRYLELGGRRPLAALLERAEILAGWSGREQEAAAAFERAVTTARETGDPRTEAIAALATYEFAQAANNDALQGWSLEQLVVAQPENMWAWNTLARRRRQSGGDVDQVFERLLAALPQSGEAHASYARYLYTTRGVDAAIAYLEERIAEGVDPPHLIAAIANLQHAVGRTADASETVERLSQYPDHPRTALARAQHALKEGRGAEAMAILRALLEKQDVSDAWEMLAHIELQLGDPEAALNAVERALASQPGYALELEQLRANILSEGGRYEELVELLVAMGKRAKLGDHELLLLARARYETGEAYAGRRLLTRLIGRARPLPGAALEFSRRHGRGASTEDSAEAARALEAALAANPGHAQLIQELVALDLAAGERERALARLTETAGRPLDPQLLLLRAQLRHELGRSAEALADAERVYASATRPPGTLRLLTQLYLAEGRTEAAIESLEAATPVDSPRRVVLSKLYAAAGDEARALEVLEESLAAGVESPALKNDLAFLLASSGGDLKRAERLALEAALKLRKNPNVADTLGYVFLKSGKNAQALNQFQIALDYADGPRPEYHYHKGLALRSLGRSREAIESFETALAIDDDFPDADAARHAIETAGSDVTTGGATAANGERADPS